MSDALAGLRLGGGEHAVLAAADEIWEVDELVTDDELEEEAAGAEVVRT